MRVAAKRPVRERELEVRPQEAACHGTAFGLES